MPGQPSLPTSDRRTLVRNPTTQTTNDTRPDALTPNDNEKDDQHKRVHTAPLLQECRSRGGADRTAPYITRARRMTRADPAVGGTPIRFDDTRSGMRFGEETLRPGRPFGRRFIREAIGRGRRRAMSRTGRRSSFRWRRP